MDLDEPVGETLAFGRDRRPRRRWVVVGVLVATVLVGALAVDRGARDQEVDALLDDLDSVSAAVVRADRRVSGMQEYLRPATSLPNVGSALGGDLVELVDGAREDARADVLAQLAQVRDDEVLPWHGDVASARELLGTYVEAEAVRVAATGDGRAAAQVDAAETVAELAGGLRVLVGDSQRSARLEESLGSLPGIQDPPR